MAGAGQRGNLTHERVVTAEFAPTDAAPQLRRDHEGDGHEVRFDEVEEQPGEPY